MQVTESSVDHVINHIRTWLDANPEWVKEGNIYKIDLTVRNEEDLNLRFCATRNDTPIGTPRFAYLFDNYRIRGLDWHASYIAFDGSRLSGWHDHLWSDKKGDLDRYPNADFEHIPVDRQLDYVLKRWNIEYREQTIIVFPEP